MFVYPTLPAKGKETVGHRQPSLESSLEAVKMPKDETDNSNGKDIKQPESEAKVVTTIINSSFHDFIHTYHWFLQFLTLAMVTSNCYQLQTIKEAPKKDTTKKPEIAADPNSSQDFIINRKKRKIVTTTKRTTSAHVTKK